MRIPLALLLILTSGIVSQVFDNCVEKPAHIRPQRDPNSWSTLADSVWRRVGLFYSAQTKNNWDALSKALEQRKSLLPHAPALSKPRNAEISDVGTYGALPSVMVHTGTGATFPVEIQSPTRFSWFQTARSAAALAYAIRSVTLESLESRDQSAETYEKLSEQFDRLSSGLVRLALEVRYLETWGPQLQIQWSGGKARGQIPKSYLLAHLSEPPTYTHLSENENDQKLRDLREYFRPHRVIHRDFFPDQLPASFELILPIATDVDDPKFLLEVSGALDTYWTHSTWAFNQGLTFKIRWLSIQKSTAFALGKQTLERHLATFPPNTLVMTTGGSITSVRGRSLVLGPGSLNPRTLAHELGHLIGFEDCYFRTVSSQGIFGNAVLEWSNPLFPDDLMCDNTVGVPRAEIW